MPNIYNKMIINSSILAGEHFELLDEGHILVDEGVIKEIGEGFVPGGIDARCYVIMPSLINAHTHLGDSFAKEAVLGLSAGGAVGRKGLKWRLYEKTGEGEIVRCMQETLQYMLYSGTSAFADFREFGLEGVRQLENALDGMPLKALILGRDVDIKVCDGLGLNVYQLDQVPEDRRGKIIAVHAGERAGEVGKALGYNPDVIVHFTHATPDDVGEAAKKKISVVVCPRSNAVLGVGIPDVGGMLDMGLNVSLGTDNVMVNSPDLFREMEFISKLSYLCRRISPVDVLRMATVNASKAFNLNSGFVGEGKRADLLFIDRSAPNLRGCRDLIAAIVHRCEPVNVRKVMVGGRFVVDRG